MAMIPQNQKTDGKSDHYQRIIDMEVEKYYRENLPQIIHDTGIPDGYRFDRETGKELTKPVVEHVFEWVWLNRDRNLLLTGDTGIGKSTSLCFAALKMVMERKKVRYVKLRNLLAEWREAKKSDSPYADEGFFRFIAELDLMVIDEAVDRAKTTESGQEMMYELLDRIADGEIKTKIWLAGNFRSGSIVDLFGDDAPVRRRIEENFLCAGITQGKVEQFHVWNGRVG